MRLLFVCDGRSPIAINWISYFVENGHEVHLVSTFEFSPEMEFKSLEFIPVGFSQLKGLKQEGGHPKQKFLWNSAFVNIRTALRRYAVPYTIDSAVERLEKIVFDIQPDLVHAMRIPYEGILTAKVMEKFENIPLVISVWGNDFTLHANATKWMKSVTRQVLSRADGLHTDCRRDQGLAEEWGFDPTRPTLVVPGNGGIDMSVFFPIGEERSTQKLTVTNPRGIRAYIRNDTFFKAIPEIITQFPTAKFICPGMAGESIALNWIEKFDLSASVELLPKVSQKNMADLFRGAAVMVSPSVHDGTPNTLLEAMACGSYPVAGDLDSIREWIKPGTNGSLIDPKSPSELATAVIEALKDEQLRKTAANWNRSLIKENAEYFSSMEKAQAFYSAVVSKKN